MKHEKIAKQVIEGFAVVENCGYSDWKQPTREIFEPLRVEDLYDFEAKYNNYSHDTQSAREQGEILAFYAQKIGADRKCSALQENDRFHKFEVVKMKITMEMKRI